MTSLGKLAFDWRDLLSEEGVTQKQFSSGIRHAVKTCKFFPKLADVLEGVEKYREAPPRPQVNEMQIEDTTSRHDLTPEEVSRNKERVGMIVGALAGRITWEEAEKGVAALQHIGEFTPDIEITSRSAT
jgi:hypothetical protein